MVWRSERDLRLKVFFALALVVAMLFGGFAAGPVKAPIVTITETRITTDTAVQWMSAIYGNRIVWTDERNHDTAGADIYMKDLSTSDPPTRITDDSANQWDPAIYGNRIVWMDERNLATAGLDIYMYDLLTSTETRITDDPEIQWMPAISGDRIVWTDYRNLVPAGTDIYMYDLLTGTETRITDAPDHQWDPAIYGNIIVWADYRNGNWDIYMAKFSISPTPSDAIEKTEDIEEIVLDPSQIPASDFDGASNKVKDNRRNTLLNMLDEVEMDIEAAKASTDPAFQKAAYQSAIVQLNAILDKTDGCSERGTPDTIGSGYTPDWITTCASQAKIDPLIRNLITMVQTLLAQIP